MAYTFGGVVIAFVFGSITLLMWRGAVQVPDAPLGLAVGNQPIERLAASAVLLVV